MTVTPITTHPRFVRVRALRIRHEHGKIIHATTWGDESLRREDVLRLHQELSQAADGMSYAAIRAGEDKRLLEQAWREHERFWAVARVCTGGPDMNLATAATILDPLQAFTAMSTLDRIIARQAREMADERQSELEEHGDETIRAFYEQGLARKEEI